MKQALVFLVIISLFSFLSAWSKSCNTEFKMACKKFTIDSCECVSKTQEGNYAYVKDCEPPSQPVCSGDSTCLNCFCSSN